MPKVTASPRPFSPSSPSGRSCSTALQDRSLTEPTHARASRGARVALNWLAPYAQQLKSPAGVGTSHDLPRKARFMLRPRSEAIQALQRAYGVDERGVTATMGAGEAWPSSPNKRHGVANFHPDADSPHLPVDVLFNVAEHYNEKHGIDLRFNGRDAALGRHVGRTDAPLPSLNPEQAAQKLLALREVARETERYIGFIHATKRVGWQIEGAGDGPAHSDAYIVTPFGAIVNLLDVGRMPSCDFTGLELLRAGADYLNCSLSRFVSAVDEPHIGVSRKLTGPQADETSCGSLVLVTLKEYLKQDGEQVAAQLLKRTLVMRMPQDTEHEQPNFLLPSPLAVRYSQSSNYLRLLRAMVASEDDHVDVPGSTGPRRVKTLAGQIRSGASCCSIDGSEVADLPAFRKEWLKIFDQQTMPQRANLNVTAGLHPTDEVTANVYLSSVIDRHMKLTGYKPSPETTDEDSDMVESVPEVPGSVSSDEKHDPSRTKARRPVAPRARRSGFDLQESDSENDSV